MESCLGSYQFNDCFAIVALRERKYSPRLVCCVCIQTASPVPVTGSSDDTKTTKFV